MISNFRKTTITMLLILCMAVSVFAVNAFAQDTDSTSTDADSTSVNHTCEKEVVEYTATQAAKYIAGDNTYPKLEGYLFAGWYNNDSCNKEDAIAGGTPSGEKVFALFVPEHVLSIQAQVSTNLIDDDVSTDADAKGSLRFITSVDSLLYKQVGFEVYYTANGVTRKATSASNKVYSKLYEMDSENVWEKTPSDTFCNLSKYFKICTLKNFTMETYMETEFTVKPYWITMDGDKVYGVEATKSFEEGCLRDTVWVTDGGVDEPNYGGYNNPYGTLDYAISHVLDGGAVRVKTALTVDAWGDEHGKSITITGNGENDDATETDSLQLETITFTTAQVRIYDDTTFEKINIELENTEGTFNAIFAEGNHLKIAENVEITNQLTQLQIFGGSDQVVENTNLELYAGTYDRIYGGGYADVSGNTNITIGGTVNKDAAWEVHDDRTNLVFGGCYATTVHGDTNITIESGAKANYIFGAGERPNSKVLGDTNIVFEGQAYAIYGGSAQGTNADTHITMEGGKVYQIFGGCESNSMTGNTDVRVLGGTVNRRIYGGCYNDDSWETSCVVNGYTSVLIDKNVTINNKELDDSIVAMSRYKSARDEERGVFIFNDYTNNATNIGQVGLGTLAGFAGISSQTHNYFVRATSGGTVTSAGDCIYIAPENGKVATVTLTSTTGEVVHYTTGNSYYPLPSVNTTSTLDIYVTFNTTEATDFIASAEAKIATGEGYAYFETLEQAIVAAEKMENATIENLSTTKKLASIVIKDSANGTLTTDKKNCLAGETVTLSGVGNEGYYCAGMKVNGEEVEINTDGTYSFTTEEQTYTIEGIFAEKVFVDHDKYNVLSQNVGILRVPSENALLGGTIQTIDSYNEITAMVRVLADDTEIFRFNESFHFENGKYTAFRISNDNADKQWRVQSAGCNVFGWGKSYNLTDAQIEKLHSDEGIEFKLVRRGLILKVYLDGVDIFPNEELNLTSKDSGITEEMSATAGIHLYGNSGYDTEIPFTVSKSPTSKITIADDIVNGNVTADKEKYVIGDMVTLNVAGTEGYYYDSFTVDGEEVVADINGNYAFIATELEHTVEASFAEPIFQAHDSYNGLSQNVGILRVPADYTEEKGKEYIRTKGSYDVVTAIVKTETGKDTEFTFWEEFGFSNGKYARFRISNTTNSTWQVESGGALFGWGDAYKSTLTDQEIAKIQNKGVEFKMVRRGTTMKVYVDGRDMFPNTTLDLTISSSGIATDTTVTAGFRLQGNVGYETEIKFQVDKISNILITDDIVNGSITTDKDMYVIGEEVTLTVAGEEGYYYDSFTVDGEEVIADINGNYTFTATTAVHTVNASFAEPIFGTNAEFNVLSQNVGVLRVPSTQDGDTDYIRTKESYDVVTAIVKTETGKDTEFTFWEEFGFSNGKYARFRISNTTNSTWQVESGGALFGWGNAYKSTLTDEEIAKIQNKGIEFKMVRKGTTMKVYVDGREMFPNTTLDLTISSSGITTDTTATAGFRLQGNVGYETKIKNNVTNWSTITIADNIANGNVTKDKEEYVIGDEVTLTVAGAEGYYYNSLTVDGEEVIADSNGNYTFTVTKTTHAINASFAEPIFVTNDKYDVLSQNVGVLRVPSANALSAGSIQTIDSYNEITAKVRVFADDTEIFRFNERFDFENGKYTAFRISNDNTDKQWRVQSVGCNVFGWGKSYNLTDAQIAKMKSEEGIEFKLVRSGLILKVYLDGVDVFPNEELNLTNKSSGITEEMSAKATLYFYGNNGYDTEIPFEVSKDLTSTITIADNIENGSVTADKQKCAIGEEVTLTVAGAEGYYYDSLTVDGEEVIADANGNYTFTTTKSYYKVEASFAEPIFATNDKYNVLSQNVGVLRVPSANALSAGYIQTNDSYNEITAQVKVFAEDTEIFRFYERFDFENGKHTAFRITNDNTDKQWRIQSAGCNVFGWGKSYNLTDAQIAKMKSEEGIEFKLVRSGLILKVYLDGVDVFPNEELNLTNKSSGITEGMSAKAKLYFYGNNGYDTEIPFEVSKDLTSTIIIADNIENGSITADKQKCAIGEEVALTVAGAEGYYYDSLTVDGEEIIADANGNYTFTTTKTYHKVEASFAPEIFNNNAEYNVLSQNVGILRVPSTQDGDTDYIRTKDSYDVVTAIVKTETGKDTEFTFWEEFGFSNGKYARFRISNTTNSTWQVESGGALFGWGNAYKSTLTEEEIAKIQSEGVEFKMVRSGTTMKVYVDGRDMFPNTTLNLTISSSGITADTTAKVGFRLQGNMGHDTDIKFQLGLTDTLFLNSNPE